MRSTGINFADGSQRFKIAGFQERGRKRLKRKEGISGAAVNPQLETAP